MVYTLLTLLGLQLLPVSPLETQPHEVHFTDFLDVPVSLRVQHGCDWYPQTQAWTAVPPVPTRSCSGLKLRDSVQVHPLSLWSTLRLKIVHRTLF